MATLQFHCGDYVDCRGGNQNPHRKVKEARRVLVLLMKCNKEDAIKAVKLAETKMQNNDFTGARKLAQKAQQLFPELENISQLLAVCEVHCSAENKLGGCEMDWYGILQIERFSYEAIIKKQYRKLGLLLHPDKNKFAGAEAAFKLIGEANAVLADQGKHFIYDMKCRALLRTGAAQSSAHQFNANLFFRKHYDAANNVQSIPQSQYISMNQHQQVQADTFCTCCTFCKAVYKFAKDSRNRLVLCQRCRRLFVASDFGIPGVHPETVRNQFANNTELPSQVSVELASVQGGTGNLPATRFRGNAALNPVSKAGITADVDEASNTEKKDNEHGVGVGKEAGTMSKSGPVKSKDSGPQSQAPPNTFWTHCPFCLSSFQCSRNFLDRLLRCHRCRKAFEAHEFGEGVHPESLRNQFLNHKEPPSQGPSNLASQSNAETDKVKFTRFQNGDAASKQVGISADLSGAPNSEKKDGVELGKKGVGTSKSGPVKSKYSGTSRNTNKKRKNSIESVERFKTGNRARADSKHVVIQEKASSPSELNGGPHLCRSTMKKQNLSYIGNQNDDDDFVNPPKWLGESQLSSATEKKRKTPDPKKEKKRKNAAVDGEPCKNDRSTDSAAAAVATQRKEARKKNSGPLEESLPRKKSKTGEFELKANMPDNGVSSFKADVSPGPNVDVASPTKIIAVPDPQFHKFALDEDRLQSFFTVNQIWALYDPADDMPRLYAFVKKVLTPGFKLKIHWLEANPDDQSEIDWCEKELPVACGKFRLGSIEEITDHLMFSHQVQVHCAKGSGKSSFLVYPRKGETWALYKNWDIGWSSEPEKHLPFRYEFVEVLSDFVDGVGTEVAHLSKVKGFFSLFERKKQGGDVLCQVPPNELYRFSHRIPSFKMNGNESDDVPEGSFEFDPAAFPTHLDELF